MRPTIAERLAHIDDAIDNIRLALAGHSRESFSDDMMRRMAVERWLEIISEASRHIPADMKAEAHAINWRRLADLGNWLRHAYHSTDAGLLWVMVEDDLEPLKLFVERMSRGSDR